MKTITVVTATRAEYGLLKPVIERLMAHPEIECRLVVTGTHLLPQFGLTIGEIEKDGIPIDAKIEILNSEGVQPLTSEIMGRALTKFGRYFASNKPDALLVLGDRYETLAVCSAAMTCLIPVIHLYGGETTEGAIDEEIRHAITKMSYLHCTATETYRKRIIQLGEAPDRVYNVGAMGVENAKKIPLMSQAELEESLGFELGNKYSIVTFHPVTLDGGFVELQCYELMKAIDQFPEMKFIITKANADAGGTLINEMMARFVRNKENIILRDSLGMRRYLSALKNASMMLGNSSSGITEAAIFHVPTVNIGDRQKGRIKPESVIDCEPKKDSIVAAMKKAQSQEFLSMVKACPNPYGDGIVTDKIMCAIEEHILSDKVNLMKKFYDIEFEE